MRIFRKSTGLERFSSIFNYIHTDRQALHMEASIADFGLVTAENHPRKDTKSSKLQDPNVLAHTVTIKIFQLRNTQLNRFSHLH